MTDISHLEALQTHLSYEHDYLAAAKSQKEIALRRVWIRQIEKEIEGEHQRLGIAPVSDEVAGMSDDDLLAALGA
jgi:hypothetical protein